MKEELINDEKELAEHTMLVDYRQNDVHLLSVMGAMLANQGLSDEAIEWYDKALKLDPKNVDILFEKGVALYNLAKFTKAVEWFDKVIAINGNNSMAIKYKRWALDKLDKKMKQEDQKNFLPTEPPKITDYQPGENP